MEGRTHRTMLMIFMQCHITTAFYNSNNNAATRVIFKIWHSHLQTYIFCAIHRVIQNQQFIQDNISSRSNTFGVLEYSVTADNAKKRKQLTKNWWNALFFFKRCFLKNFFSLVSRLSLDHFTIYFSP